MRSKEVRNVMMVMTLIVGGIAAGSILGNGGYAGAQQDPSFQSSDALWNLPKFGESGWFLHAHYGQVRACNMDGASVAGERQAPKCSNWQ